jgi:hypothetical protein
MSKPFVRVFGIIAFGITASGVNAAQTDTLTRLPLYPGTAYASSDTQNVCGTKVRSATYSPKSANLATVDRWYAAHLNGFKLVHGTTRDYPYDVFVRADDTMSVTILGSGPNSGVEAIVYHSNAKPSSAANLINWLDGSASICR